MSESDDVVDPAREFPSTLASGGQKSLQRPLIGVDGLQLAPGFCSHFFLQEVCQWPGLVEQRNLQSGAGSVLEDWAADNQQALQNSPFD